MVKVVLALLTYVAYLSHIIFTCTYYTGSDGRSPSKKKKTEKKNYTYSIILYIIYYYYIIIVYILSLSWVIMRNLRDKRRLMIDWGILDSKGNLTKQMQDKVLDEGGDVYQNIAKTIQITLKFMEFQGSVEDDQDFMDLVEEAIGRMIDKAKEQINKDKDN